MTPAPDAVPIAEDQIELGLADINLDEVEKPVPSSSYEGSPPPRSCSTIWTQTVQAIKAPFVKAVMALSNHAATHPRSYVVGTILFSALILVTGLMTNFSVDVDEDVLWTPRNSKPVEHGEWVDDESGFVGEPRYYQMLIHNDGDNVLTRENVRLVFEALDSVLKTPGYDDLCRNYAGESGIEVDGEVTCDLHAITAFWGNSLESFESQVTSDDDLIEAVSATDYPDGEPVDRPQIMGNAVVGGNGKLTSVQSFVVTIDLPSEDDPTEKFEDDALDRTLEMRDDWADDDSVNLKLEAVANRSFADEFTRAIVKDIPLIPIVFVIMAVFCCVVFYRRDKVRSQSLLGFGAVVSVLLAIMTGYGLLFVIGTPFTSLTQILPFVMFGIGLDDAFIIMGSYGRTDHSKDAVERIHDTMQDIGGSILLTTITSSVAFALGCTSSIPAVYYLCLYAFPTILLDFIYQVTFFVALIVIDEGRMKRNKRDCCVWLSVAATDKEAKTGREEEEEEAHDVNFAERFMAHYSEFLMKPTIKALVIILFMILLGICAWSASELTQAFDFTDVIPDDSYITPFVDSFEIYTENRAFQPAIFFRDVDFADPDVQEAMLNYVNELSAMDHVSEPPVFFWLRDFQDFVSANQDTQSMPFNEQVDTFLNDPVYSLLYSLDIVRNENGDITASRTQLYMDLVDGDKVKEQVDALEDQRRITKNQPINRGESDWKFFTFDGVYYIWEFYSVAVDELILTTILGIVAVSAISLIFIPHWTAAFFVTPLVIILYVDLLGIVQFAGLHVNSVTYIGMVMSIGLMVDYVMHVVISYYESGETADRESRVKSVLKTTGASILIGGLSTLLGIIPLAFSTSQIFWTIFVIFIGLVTLGISHGLILLPVVLSLVGPLDSVAASEKSSDPKTTLNKGVTMALDEDSSI